MVANEAAREELRRSLERVLGAAETATLMGVLPTEQPATKSDLEAHRAATRSDLEALEERMDARFGRIEARFGQIDEKIDHRFEVFEYKLLAALHQEIAALHHEIGMVRTDFTKQLIGQTKAFIFAMLSTLIALAALGVAALRLA